MIKLPFWYLLKIAAIPEKFDFLFDRLDRFGATGALGWNIESKFSEI